MQVQTLLQQLQYTTFLDRRNSSLNITLDSVDEVRVVRLQAISQGVRPPGSAPRSQLSSLCCRLCSGRTLRMPASSCQRKSRYESLSQTFVPKSRLCLLRNF